MDFAEYKQKALPNFKEEFWCERFLCNSRCPECLVNNDLLVTVTKKSVRVYCQNEQCKKLFFYRRANLGMIEGFKPE